MPVRLLLALLVFALPACAGKSDSSDVGSPCDALLSAQAACPTLSWMSTYSDIDQCERAYANATSDEERSVFESCGSCIDEAGTDDCSALDAACGGSC